MAKEQVITIRMKEEDLKKLDNKAKEAKLTRSELIRNSISRELNNKTLIISKEQRNDLNKLKELLKITTDEELVAKLMNSFKLLNIRNQDEYRSKWKIDDRRKIITRFSSEMEYLTEDITSILKSDIPKLKLKYKDNKSKRNLISVMKHTLQVMRAEDSLNNQKKKQEQDQLVNELEALRKEIAKLKKEKLKARLDNN